MPKQYSHGGGGDGGSGDDVLYYIVIYSEMQTHYAILGFDTDFPKMLTRLLYFQPGSWFRSEIHYKLFHFT